MKNTYYTQQTKFSSVSKNRYSEFLELSTPFTVIPGLRESAIPQGMCYSKKYNMIITSSYFQKDRASVLFFIDFVSGKLVKTLFLANPDGSSYKGHTGGIATDDNVFWLVDDYRIYSFSLENLMASSDMSNVSYDDVVSTFTKADFARYHDGIFWVGEYYYPKIYPTKAGHDLETSSGDKNYALLTGYSVDDSSMLEDIQYVISIPDRVQGLAFTSDGEFIISQSFWSFQSSNIKVFQNVLEKEHDDYYMIDDKKIPLWYLDSSVLNKDYRLPPMSEAIVSVDDSLYVLFESASNYYKWYTHDSVNYIAKMKIKK